MSKRISEMVLEEAIEMVSDYDMGFVGGVIWWNNLSIQEKQELCIEDIYRLGLEDLISKDGMRNISDGMKPEELAEMNEGFRKGVLTSAMLEMK